MWDWCSLIFVIMYSRMLYDCLCACLKTRLRCLPTKCGCSLFKFLFINSLLKKCKHSKLTKLYVCRRVWHVHAEGDIRAAGVGGKHDERACQLWGEHRDAGRSAGVHQRDQTMQTSALHRVWDKLPQRCRSEFGVHINIYLKKSTFLFKVCLKHGFLAGPLSIFW